AHGPRGFRRRFLAHDCHLPAGLRRGAVHDQVAAATAAAAAFGAAAGALLAGAQQRAVDVAAALSVHRLGLQHVAAELPDHVLVLEHLAEAAVGVLDVA